MDKTEINEYRRRTREDTRNAMHERDRRWAWVQFAAAMTQSNADTAADRASALLKEYDRQFPNPII